MDPMTDKMLSCASFGLRDFIFMVRENIIDATNVDVYGLTKSV